MTICERMFVIIDSDKSKSASDLCRHLGINTSVTTSWRQRNTDPPAKYLIQICEYLDVTPYYLLTGEDEQPIDEFTSLNDDEKRMLSKYRVLDADGRDAVRGVLLTEQRRVESEKGTRADAG